MTIDYTNTFDDVLAFARHHYHRSDGIQRNVKLQRYGGVAILIGYFFGLGCFGGSLFYIFVGLVTATAWWVWIPRVLFATYEKQVARSYEGHKNKGTFGQHRLEVTPSHLKETNEYGGSTVSWPAIERVDSNDECTFIHLSSAHAHIVPKHRVVAGDYDAFVRAARAAFQSTSV